MRILWVTNIPLPEVSIILNTKLIPYGGWLVNTSKLLTADKHINLSVAFPYNKIINLRQFNGEKITYYSFPPVKNKKDITNNKFLIEILEKSNPDIVHIYGTEYPHALATVNACIKKKIKVVISIQGLVSIIAKHYRANLPNHIIKKYTLRDLIKNDNIKHQQRKFQIRGKFEIEALKKVENVIGRTTWDKACTTQINPNINYYHLNEILREEFYNHTWNINDIERYSIFISQGSYAIKGLHFMIEALPIILTKFPKTKLYIAGNDITKSKSLREKLKTTSYGKYIRGLIKKNKLENHVEFIGVLDEKQICEKYLKTHVFVSPSVIENESNSLSEAKILGVPSIASYVGGVIDRLEHKVEGFLYQHDAPYMLAHYIIEIFSNDKLAIKFSKNSRKRASQIHDKELNIRKLIEIYREVINNKI